MADNKVYKSQLIELLEHVHRVEQKLIASMSEQEREAAGEPDHWAAKDELAHLAYWHEHTALNIQRVKRGEEPQPSTDDDNQANTRIFEQYRHSSFAEVFDLSERSHQAMLNCVRGLSEEDLTSTEFLPDQNGRPLWRFVVGDGLMHTITHLAHIYNERSETQMALAIQVEAAELLAGLSDSQQWKGVLTYNLACQYSLSGEKDRAVALLREGLALDPSLTEWSKQDPDFDPIRADPDYQAIYEV